VGVAAHSMPQHAVPLAETPAARAAAIARIDFTVPLRKARERRPNRKAFDKNGAAAECQQMKTAADG
jgi:hypothetical protein